MIAEKGTERVAPAFGLGLILAALAAGCAAPPALPGQKMDGQESREGRDTSRPAPPPLPLHTIEGTGGAFFVPSAYLVNAAPPEESWGRPSFGYIHTHLGHGKNLQALTLTETIAGRLELGYGLDYLNTGDLYEDVANAGMPRPSGHAVKLHNLNARFQAFREGDLGTTWLPAMTLGVHYKFNESIEDLDEDLNGGLKSMVGIEDDQGFDFTLTTSRMFTGLPRPLLVTAGLRCSEAAHIGLLGFTGEWRLLFEGNLCLMATDRLILSAEFRQKPSDYEALPDLIEPEDDWFALCASYIASENVNISVGYGRFGRLLNHRANRAWGVAVKYEF